MTKTKYLFAIYSNSDYEQIDNIFLELFKNGIHVKSAKDAPKSELDTLIAEAEAILYVVSENSLYSATVQYHFQLAEQFNKNIIPYFLASPNELRMSGNLLFKLNGSASIPAYQFNTEYGIVNKAIKSLTPYFSDTINPKKRKKNPLMAILALVLILGVSFLIYTQFIKPSKHNSMIQNIKDSTVQIYSEYEKESEDEPGKVFHYKSTGSGFFVDSVGTLITNYHVVDSGSVFYILEDDTKYMLTLMAFDDKADLAALKIEDKYTVTNYLTLSDDLVGIGDDIYVAGFPKGIDLTISNGIISNNHHLFDIENVVYSDYCDTSIVRYLFTAATSSGSSGGPVVSISGEVIAVNKGKYIDAENMNIAIPVTYVKEMLDKITTINP